MEEGVEVQHEERICEILARVVEPYIFQTDNCCMNTGIISVEGAQFSNTVTQHVVDEVLIFENVRREQEIIFVNVNEIEFSMEDNMIESFSNSDHVKHEAIHEEHCDKTLSKHNEEIELLEKLLGGNGNRKEMVTAVLENSRESLKDIEREERFNSQTNSLFPRIVNRMNECDVVIEEIEHRLFGDEMEVQKK